MSLKLYIIAAILSGAVIGHAAFYFNSSDVKLEWVQTYDFQQQRDGATSVAVDDSGNVYVTGISWGGVFGAYDDYATIKYNSSGVQLWVQRYNGVYSGFDWAYSIALDDSCNVLVTGRADGVYTTIKYSPAGVLRWKREYTATGVSDTNIAYVVKSDRLGNVFVTGTSTGASGTYRDYATIKYNSSGVQQWVARYNGPVGGYDEASDLEVDDSGNVYVTGTSQGLGPQQTDIATVKYNSSGIQQWVQRYTGIVPGYSFNRGNSVALDSSANVYVAGNGTVTPGLGVDYVTVKYSSSGIQQWLRGYSGTTYGSYDGAKSIAVDSFANVYVTGESSGTGSGFDFATVKYNSLGVQLWVQRWNGPANGEDTPNSLALDSSGNVYITGITDWYNVGDYATVKYTSAGVQQWVQLYNGAGNGIDWASSIAVDKQYNVYVTGSSLGQGTQADYATVKYSQLVGIQPVTGELPTEYRLYQNYPNPFNPVTRIKFSLPLPSEGGAQAVLLAIYDILGRQVDVLINKELEQGTYVAEWDAAKYPSAIYFYTLKAGDFSNTKKMVLMK